MSWKSGSNGGRSKRAAWSGAGGSREQPLHRWQDPSAAPQSARPRYRRPRSRWLIVTAMAAGLLAVFVYLLLTSPRMTPLVVIAATEYDLPVPLNPWALEDRESFAPLDGQNITITDRSDEWNRLTGARTKFLPNGFQPKPSRDGEPLILYISMHGVVNDRDEPCLLAPGAPMHDSAKWTRIEDLLKEIERDVVKKAPQRKTLLILDCHRIRMNWSLGILSNSFAERLKEVVDKNPVPNLAVLTAAGPGQVSWASADLQGSAFARFLQLGLAGAADQAPTANRNGEVSLRELAAYLAREVAAWSQLNRGERQTPVLIAPGVDDFRLTRVRTGALDDLLAKSAATEQKATRPPVSGQDIQALWSDLEVLRTYDLVRYDPVACRDFEHELLRLEEFSQGGAAYAKKATERFNSLQNRLSQAVGRARKSEGSRGLADHLAMTSEKSWARITAAAHTLPASEYFGACDAERADRIELLWRSLMTAGDQQDGKSIVKDSPDRELAEKLAETHFRLAARQQEVNSLWPSKPDILTSVLERRNTAEALAVPRGAQGAVGDERAHIYARYAADQADAQRRLAEDLLFIGEKDAPDDYEKLAAQADTLYAWTNQVMDDVSQAFALHDVVLAETPYLAAWLCSPLADDVPERDKLINGRLTRLIRNAHELGNEINRPEKLGENEHRPQQSDRLFLEQKGQVQVDFDAVTNEFRSAISDLTSGSAQGTAGWRAIEAVLSTPLVAAKQRSQLLKNQSDIAAALHKKYLSKTEASDEETPTKDKLPASDDVSAYLRAISRWNAHPLLEILQIAPATSEDGSYSTAWCAAAATQVRSRFAAIPANSSLASQSAEHSAQDATSRHRHRLSRAERELRAAAAIDFDPATGTADPVSNLRRFDLQQLLVWHGQRAMDDFWGDLPSQLQEEPFFVAAANDYFKAAKDLSGESGFALDPQIESHVSRLNERRQAKCEPLEIAATSELLDEASGAVVVSVKVRCQSAAYPPGWGALYLQDRSKRLPSSRIDYSSADAKAFLELPPQSASQERQIMLPNTARISKELDAVAFFRGRQISDPVELSTLDGPLVDYKPHQYRSQKITLSGDRLQPSSIVFILDCSGSMRQTVALERRAAAGARNEPPRMDQAKKALELMLDELASRNAGGAETTRVGVRFFGHRAGWQENVTPLRELRQESYLTKFPPLPNRPFTPSTDIEVVQTLGRFEPTEAENVRARLHSVIPWGETPLFLALEQALEDFDHDLPGTRKSIIAITDGKNQQYRPTTTLQDVLNALRKDVQIHILGFDIPQNQAQAARMEYTRITDATGGKYLEVNSFTDLMKRLRDRLDLDGYLVSDQEGKWVNPIEEGEPVPAKLGSPVDIPGTRLPHKFTAAFQRANPKQVLLEGGEAIALHVRQNGSTQEIVALPYGDSVVAEAFLEGGTRPTHQLRVHRPIREDRSVTFPISIQVIPQIYHFTQRPVETWVEITPVSSAGAAAAPESFEPYLFYDTNFEPDEPVPVLKWTALKWPENADRAQIRFWCKYAPTNSLLKISPHDAAFRRYQPLPGMSDVQLKIRQPTESNGNYRIYAVERHGPQSPGVGAIRVHFETAPRIKPSRVRHQFDSRNRIATHTYEFPPSLSQEIERFEGSQIVVTRAADVKNGALHSPSGSRLDVRIDETGDLHSPNATASGLLRPSVTAPVQ